METGVLSVEKRKFPRVPLDATVRFRKLSDVREKEEAKSNFGVAHSKDLSKGGIALVETAALGQGDLIKIEIEIPGRELPIKAYSEVMWIKPPDSGEDDPLEIVGIKFMGLKPDDEKFLVGLVREAVSDGKELDGEASRLSEKEFIKKMGQRFKGE